MTSQNRPRPLYIAFWIAMLLLIAIGVFMIIWGSLHNAAPMPTLTGPGLYARGFAPCRM